MPPDHGCPDAHRLEQLILGQLHGEQVEPLEDHVARCAVCLSTLGSLPAVDPLVEAVRSARQHEETCPDLVRALVRGLKRLQTHDTTVTHLGKQAPSVPESFDFLDPPRDGDELGWLGPYRVLRLLGAGGMGMVFLAEDPRLQRQIALKVIKPDLLPRDDMRARFLQEARTVAAVEHENIVAIHEVEEYRGVPYLAMPLLRGESLDERLRGKRGALPLEETLRIARQIAAGLAEAHKKGLIHRDIKPANIFLAGERVKILDFGLARDLSQDEEGGAHLGVLVGTPAYMAPEQAAGQRVDGRADLFSFGCVLYRMATGRAAFDGMDLYTILICIATEEPVPPGQVNPALPAELSRLILQLLAKKPEDRPATADEVVSVLTKIDEERSGRRGSRRRWLAAAGVGLVAVAGFGGWLAALPRKPTPPEPGEVTFELDEPKTGVTLIGPEEMKLSLEGQLVCPLLPGRYDLKAIEQEPRILWPNRFDLQPGERLSLPLRLVGEVRKTWLEPIASLACSPRKGDLRVLAACRDNGVGIWDAARNDKPRFFEEHKVPVRAVAISPDGRQAASGGGKQGSEEGQEILVWDIETRKPLNALQGHESWVQALAFAPDGQRLASGGNDGEGYIWDLKTKKKLAPFAGHDRLGINGLAFTPDGTQLLTVGGDNVVCVWNARTGDLLYKLQGHIAAVRRVAVASNQVALSTGEDGSVWLWDLPTRKGREFFKPSRRVVQAVFTLDGRRVLWGAADGSLGLWDLADEKEVYRFAGHKRAVTGVACTAEGRKAVSCSQDGTVRLWELPH